MLHMRDLPTRLSTRSLLYAHDKGMQRLYVEFSGCHWSNSLVENPSSYSTSMTPKLHDLDVIERGSRDLLGHLIEIGLTNHVEAILKSNPGLIQAKQGRPYLDYALRCDRNAPFRLKHLKQAHTDGAMVEMLLNLGCDVNEVVHVHGSRTVWDSYLYYIHYNRMNDKRDHETAWL
jgi:hypothetical protein